MAASEQVVARAERISWAEFEAYFTRTDYSERYPHYIKEFGTGRTLRAKALEHFLSFRFLRPKSSEVVMDVAASNSPCADIMKRDFAVSRAIRQDLNFPAGVQSDTIGSPASRIPLEDGSLDMIMLHNSWEHFEGDEDLCFLFEAQRLLKPGGRLIIIPLFMSDRLEIWTSLSVWEGKYRAPPQTPSFDLRAVVVVKEDIKQRQSKHFDVQSLMADLGHVAGLSFEFIHFENFRERDFGFPFAPFAIREPQSAS